MGQVVLFTVGVTNAINSLLTAEPILSLFGVVALTLQHYELLDQVALSFLLDLRSQGGE